MELKLDDAGHVVLDDGKPVYVGDDGKDIAIDVPHMWTKVHELGKESAKHRVAAKEALDKLAAFEGIDPDGAREALKVVGNLDDKKLIDAGEVERVKAAITESYEKRLADANAAVAAKDEEVRNLLVGQAFRASPFIADKMTQLPEFAQAYFGKHFTVEDGKVVAKDAAGEVMLSATRPGEPATFDEAIEQLVSSHPQRDHLLRSGKPGSGATNTGNRVGGAKKLAEMTPSEKGDFIRENGLEKYKEVLREQMNKE